MKKDITSLSQSVSTEQGRAPGTSETERHRNHPPLSQGDQPAHTEQHAQPEPARAETESPAWQTGTSVGGLSRGCLLLSGELESYLSHRSPQEVAPKLPPPDRAADPPPPFLIDQTGKDI
ncbi:hypothetical protein EYF80_037003 [Liparis tanakae]|uniref:Uncharacterized protein n=1 Tax=Liparis tanakae TaxID=230148 RepID=A0A4Z2GHH1_9TELE|nr:hypothetical protein EYF80_037003 [Liparis tanakae]